MAQVQKDNIRRIILESARGEFLQKGFKNTSMRTISRLSGITLSNIYNYFRDTFADRYTEESLRYLKVMKERYPNIKTDFSDFFLHLMCSLWLTVMGEIVSHDELTDTDIEQFITEYITFGTAGWKALMKI